MPKGFALAKKISQILLIELSNTEIRTRATKYWNLEPQDFASLTNNFSPNLKIRKKSFSKSFKEILIAMTILKSRIYRQGTKFSSVFKEIIVNETSYKKHLVLTSNSKRNVYH